MLPPSNLETRTLTYISSEGSEDSIPSLVCPSLRELPLRRVRVKVEGFREKSFSMSSKFIFNSLVLILLATLDQMVSDPLRTYAGSLCHWSFLYFTETVASYECSGFGEDDGMPQGGLGTDGRNPPNGGGGGGGGGIKPDDSGGGGGGGGTGIGRWGNGGGGGGGSGITSNGWKGGEESLSGAKRDDSGTDSWDSEVDDIPEDAAGSSRTRAAVWPWTKPGISESSWCSSSGGGTNSDLLGEEWERGSKCSPGFVILRPWVKKDTAGDVDWEGTGDGASPSFHLRIGEDVEEDDDDDDVEYKLVSLSNVSTDRRKRQGGTLSSILVSVRMSICAESVAKFSCWLNCSLPVRIPWCFVAWKNENPIQIVSN